METVARSRAFKWTDAYTRALINARNDHKDCFTGKRNPALGSAWNVVLKQMGLEGLVSVQQVKKKWDNLVHRYKEIKNARIVTGNAPDSVTASWPFYKQMEATMANSPLVTLPVVIASILNQEGVQASLETGSELLLEQPLGETHMLMTFEAGASNVTPGAAASSSGAQAAASARKRKREPEDEYMELFKQAREDWLQMHVTMEKQGEKMIALFQDAIKSMKQK